MKTLKSACIIIACMALSACSNKPSVGDVEASLPEFKGCPLFKIGNFKEINGIPSESANKYKLQASYDIEVLGDIPKDVANQVLRTQVNPSTLPAGCTQAKVMTLLGVAQVAGANPTEGLKKGLVLHLSPTFNMIKSDKGWIIEE
jgi:hypothetical protein